MVLFSRQGYHRTSTREIARLANLSEVTIYRHFAHKEEIFWSALNSSFNCISPRLKLLGPTSRGEAPEVMLPRILGLLQDAVSLSPEMMRLTAIALMEVRGKSEAICREYLTQLFTAIADYLEANIEKGKIRNLNPSIAAAAIAITTLAQSEISTFIRWDKLPTMESRQTIDECAAFWLNALVPSPQEQSPGIENPAAVFRV